MNFLTPLYALAVLAISVPILLHLVRRQPKNRFEFSSHLFLQETPPRLTRNSRVENWLLLLLRSLVLLMIAVAFARPYWSEAVDSSGSSTSGIRKCILIDQSASMRREGVWPQAIQQARDAVETALPTDIVSVYSFDSELRSSFPLSQARSLPIGKRTSSSMAALDSISPSWAHSDLGAALVGCLDALQVDSAENDRADAGPAQIIVISDLTAGSDVQALADGQWPDDVTVQLISVSPIQPGNASFVLLEPTEASDESEHYRVRVSNARDSLAESFQLRWRNDDEQAAQKNAVECTVPRGSHRIVKLPAPPESASAIELLGDNCPFDNQRFVVRDPVTPSFVHVVEQEGLPPEESLAYFLERVPLDTVYRKVQVQRCLPGSPWMTDPAKQHRWVVLSHAATLRDADLCKIVLQNGGYVTLVMDCPADSPHHDGGTIGEHYRNLASRCAEVDLGRVSEKKVREFDFLQRLDFGHPILATLANSQYNDFSRVRFWKHRSLELSELSGWRTLAFFAENHPAILERDMDRGKFLIMTSGWQPGDSQLALSSKFVPLMSGIYAQAQSDSVGGNEWIAGADRAPVPGIYPASEDSSDRRRIAANLDPRESLTDPMDPSELTRLGVRLASDQPSEQIAAQRERVLIAAELESRQAWWWWLVSACLVAVGMESLLCWSRSAPAPSFSLAKE